LINQRLTKISFLFVTVSLYRTFSFPNQISNSNLEKLNVISYCP